MLIEGEKGRDRKCVQRRRGRCRRLSSPGGSRQNRFSLLSLFLCAYCVTAAYALTGKSLHNSNSNNNNNNTIKNERIRIGGGGNWSLSLFFAFVNAATVLMTSPLPPSLFTRSAGFTHFLILLLLLLLVPLDNSSQARRLLRH